MLLLLPQRPVSVLCSLERVQALWCARSPVADAESGSPDVSATDVQASRKMGTYYLATLLFKTYFKVSCPFLRLP